MSDYSWIKPGVKAVVINDEKHPSCIGEIITISSFPYKHSNGHMIVEFEEGLDFGRRLGRDMEVVVRIKNIAPLRDDSQQLTTWDAITKTIGTDIRTLEHA